MKWDVLKQILVAIQRNWHWKIKLQALDHLGFCRRCNLQRSQLARKVILIIKHSDKRPACYRNQCNFRIVSHNLGKTIVRIEYNYFSICISRFLIFLPLKTVGLIIPDICHERHERRSCKFFLASVNFYRFNAKNWHFRQILREKVALFFYRFNAKNWRFSV